MTEPILATNAPARTAAQFILEGLDTTTISALDEHLLIHYAWQGNEQARASLVAANARFVIARVKYMCADPAHRDDALQVGLAALVYAAAHVDPKKNNRFLTYAAWVIRSWVGKYLREKTAAIRIPQHLWSAGRTNVPCATISPEKLDVLVEQLYARDSVYRYAVFAEDVDARIDIARVLATLGERERYVLVHLYGIGGVRPQTLEEIGDVLGLSRQRIEQIKAKALKRLRHPARMKALESYQVGGLASAKKVEMPLVRAVNGRSPDGHQCGHGSGSRGDQRPASRRSRRTRSVRPVVGGPRVQDSQGGRVVHRGE